MGHSYAPDAICSGSTAAKKRESDASPRALRTRDVEEQEAQVGGRRRRRVPVEII